MVVGSNDTGEISTSHDGMVLIVENDEDHAVFNILFWSRWVTWLSAPEPAQSLEILPTPPLHWSSWTRCSARWTDLQRVERSVSVLRCR